MHVVKTLPDLIELREQLRRAHGGLGLVATMGALHAGHAALLQAARTEGQAVAASIFVNPLQFAANEDFAAYPRDEAADLRALEKNGCDLVWLPDVDTMYPPGSATSVEVAGPALEWEGRQRPGHFRGMATVVAKLFGQVRPEWAYFGEKDWQQVQVVRRMVEDLLLPVEIVAVPTVRDDDGLALSSRNRYLSAEQRRGAPLLFEVLHETAATLSRGVTAAAPLAAARERLDRAGFGVDYLELVDATRLTSIETAREPARLIAAARLGPVRLLDNIAVPAPG